MTKKLLFIMALSTVLYFFYEVKEKKNGEATVEKTSDNKTEKFPKEELSHPAAAIQPIQVSTPKVPEKKSLTKVIKLKPQNKTDKENYNIQDPEGNIYITQVQIDGELLIAHGDLIVGETKDLETYSNGEKPLVLPKPNLWDKGIVPYEISDVDPLIESNIKNTLESFQQQTGIKFPKRKDQKDWVVFKQGPNHCYSHVGKIGGPQTISLSLGCGEKEISHEIMHTLGFFHEQNREDREEHIAVLWENIEEKFWPQFKKIKNHLFKEKNFEFDYESLMLYPNHAFAITAEYQSLVTIDGEEWSIPNGLSDIDIRKVKAVYFPSKFIYSN